MEKDEIRAGILQAANKHPNSRVSKLIRAVEEERSQKNIVLLLIELAEHAEYATDFGISLKYYLDLFEKLGIRSDIVLNEAGLLLLNSAKIYSRRVDYVQELVERQILSLSSADQEITEAKNAQQNAIADKPKKGRKRRIEAHTDPCDVELIPKKIRKLSAEKRFAISRPTAKAKTSHQRNAEQEQYIHPAAWQHSHIVDLDNEEEIDSKRNYKLFTHHVEHRYNTLVPDINFRLHFLFKDFIDEGEERLEEAEESGELVNPTDRAEIRTWPPLSAEYVEKYLRLENRILGHETRSVPRDRRPRVAPLEVASPEKSALSDSHTLENSLSNDVHFSEGHESTELGENTTQNTTANISSDKESSLLALNSTANDSGLGQSVLDSSHDDSCANANETSTSVNNDSVVANTADNVDAHEATTEVVDNTESKEEPPLDQTALEEVQNPSAGESGSINRSSNDSGLGTSLLDASMPNNDESLKEKTTEETQVEDASKTEMQPEPIIDLPKEKPSEQNDINLNEIRVHLPHLDDEGVFFSDLDMHEYQMLSPSVVATDVLPFAGNKKNITIIVDDEIKALLNILDDVEEPETYEMPVLKRPTTPPLVLNILKIHEKLLRHRVLFKLGPEMDLYMQARSLKRSRIGDGEPREPRQTKLMKLYSMNNTDMAGIHMTPPASPGNSESDFCGFSDAGDYDNEDRAEALHRLSRDSGVGVDIPGGMRDKIVLDTILEEFGNCESSAIAEAIKMCEFDGAVNGEGEKETKESDQEKTTETPNESEELLTESSMNLTNSEQSTETQKESEDLLADSSANLTNSEQSTETQKESEDLLADSVMNSEQSIETLKESEDLLADSSANLTSSEQSTESLLNEADDLITDSSFALLQDLDNSTEEIDLNTSKTKIQQWHEHLLPILAKSRERHHFDVYQIGTEIIEELQTATEGNCDSDNASDDDDDQERRTNSITFQDVMANKDGDYVSRYFLSSLLLANQGNIHINVLNKSSEEPSEWSDIKFELLSTKRHTVAIEDNIGLISTKATTQPRINKTSSKKPKLSESEAPSCSSSGTLHVNLPADAVNVNLNFVKPLIAIEKVPRSSDDYDSGIFSNEESVL